MEYINISCVKKGDTRISKTTFEELEAGDIFFSHGIPYTVGVEAHYSGDASYDGYLLYDENDREWFPEDPIDKDAEPILLKNLQVGDKVWVEGDCKDLWITNCSGIVSSMATVICRPKTRAKKVHLCIDNVGDNKNVHAFVRQNRLHMAF